MLLSDQTLRQWLCKVKESAAGPTSLGIDSAVGILLRPTKALLVRGTRINLTRWCIKCVRQTLAINDYL
jgi:hypothetical protein